MPTVNCPIIWVDGDGSQQLLIHSFMCSIFFSGLHTFALLSTQIITEAADAVTSKAAHQQPLAMHPGSICHRYALAVSYLCSIGQVVIFFKAIFSCASQPRALWFCLWDLDHQLTS